MVTRSFISSACPFSFPLWMLRCWTFTNYEAGFVIFVIFCQVFFGEIRSLQQIAFWRLNIFGGLRAPSDGSAAAPPPRNNFVNGIMAAREKWLAPLVKPRRGPKQEGRKEGDIPPDLILKLTRRPPRSQDPQELVGWEKNGRILIFYSMIRQTQFLRIMLCGKIVIHAILWR